MLGDKILDNLHLFLLGRVSRANEQALNAADFLRRLIAAVARLIEERIVHRLWDKRKDFVLGLGGHGLDRPNQGGKSDKTRYLH
jgi:hypothetical protein